MEDIQDLINRLRKPDEPLCDACRIEKNDEQVKQMPRHTCGIDEPNPDISEIKADIKKQQPTDPNEAYNAEVNRYLLEHGYIEPKT